MTNREIKALEPWPGYFELRASEIDVFFKFWKPANIENLLEVGCGLGFVSTIFSGVAERVFATDLIAADSRTNTPGMGKTVKFLEGQDKKNIFFFGGDASTLAVRSNCMDAVFSMNILEHVPLDKRNAVIQEMKRVLNKKGYIMAVVPTATERIGNFFYYYADLALRLFRKAFVNMRREKSDKGLPPCTLDEKKTPILKRLLPPIHGYYKSRLEELYNQFPFKWETLFKDNGLSIVKTFTIRFLPFSTSAFISLYKRTNRIEGFLGDKFPFKYLGKNYCIIAKRTDG